MSDKGKEDPDPQARWRRLPPEPAEWVEESDREAAAVDYGSDYDPDRAAVGNGTG
ncbi:hypothetical protein GPX89_02930 [Nocardia sp. ET3-3]|uniref:Uncharacterized protein n=1 Tax=Nocardia terrae TaxID=2675851 RepID=A0A7K1UPC5_9NOCA|nr:hypothetical protein [Nocardia terrae]MVU76193.1 hypothetical protein [Nocardia terrae]